LFGQILLKFQVRRNCNRSILFVPSPDIFIIYLTTLDSDESDFNILIILSK